MSTTERPLLDLDHRFARELPELAQPWQADSPPAPRLLALNESLATDLGLAPDALRSADGIGLLTGTLLPDAAVPIAQAYAGHQFGGWSPRLGDGRALLLGEVRDVHGRLRDVHLKGSGRTPFARGGDGKAVVGPMLREYVIGEAMHALGIPTTRALAVVATGEMVRREVPQPGAVLTRVAASHLRVGTFQYAASLQDLDLLERLAAHAVDRHHPRAVDALGLYESVVEAQASLVARWMLVGFVHGVMNTDNTTISGETIDYGPCAFMDTFDPATVFSSIDHGGRYAYGQQPKVLQWNLARLAEAMLPLFGLDEQGAVPPEAVETATTILRTFGDRYRLHWATGMRAKLGLVTERPDDGALFDDLQVLLHQQRLDHTRFHRRLSRRLVDPTLPTNEAMSGWFDRWHVRLAAEGRDPAAVAAAMDAVNPVYIPRNHLVEEALDAAMRGDLDPFEQLVAVVSDPFTERPGLDRYADPAPDAFPYVTYCGT